VRVSPLFKGTPRAVPDKGYVFYPSTPYQNTDENFMIYFSNIPYVVGYKLAKVELRLHWCTEKQKGQIVLRGELNRCA
jgi:hypothetical protein